MAGRNTPPAGVACPHPFGHNRSPSADRCGAQRARRARHTAGAPAPSRSARPVVWLEPGRAWGPAVRRSCVPRFARLVALIQVVTRQPGEQGQQRSALSAGAAARQLCSTLNHAQTGRVRRLLPPGAWSVARGRCAGRRISIVRWTARPEESTGGLCASSTLHPPVIRYPTFTRHSVGVS